ncbi:LemA family protein [Bradyrhizobium sp. CAR08]
MKKWIAIGVVVLVGLWALTSFNGFVRMDENVQNSYAQVQNVMQRQADLIPNLVETAKAYAGHENKTLVGVAEARSKLSTVAKMDPDKLAKDPDLQKQLIEAQQTMQKSVVELNMVREAYPQLQANENFRALMSELSGSVNRIAVERMRNQQTVRDYNAAVRTLPRSLLASAGGFTPKPYFQASDTAQGTPQVKF